MSQKMTFALCVVMQSRVLGAEGESGLTCGSVLAKSALLWL